MIQARKRLQRDRTVKFENVMWCVSSYILFFFRICMYIRIFVLRGRRLKLYEQMRNKVYNIP